MHQDFSSTDFLHFNRTTINIVAVVAAVVVYCCNLWVSGCGLFLSFLIYIFQLLSCVCFVYNAIKIVFNSFRPTIFYIIFRKILFESLLSIWMQLSKCNSSLSWLFFFCRFYSSNHDLVASIHSVMPSSISYESYAFWTQAMSRFHRIVVITIENYHHYEIISPWK